MIFVKICSILLIIALISGLTSALAAENINIVVNPGEDEFDIVVHIPGVSNAYGSADFDVIINDWNALDIKKESDKPAVSFKSGMEGKVADPRTDGNQKSYMVGFYSEGGNDFKEAQDACTIFFKYTGSNPCVITIRNFRLHRYIGGAQVVTQTLDLEYTYNVSAGSGQTQKTAAPTASPLPGTYNTAQTVTLSSNTPGAIIYYTTNGTDPTTASTPYSSSIAVSQTTTIKAIAVSTGRSNSDVSIFDYKITGRQNSPESNNKSGEQITDPEIPLASLFPFSDVKENDWFYGDVYYMWENELMNGVNSTLFSPNTPITRGMVATILYRLEGKPDTTGLSASFSDVETGVYYTDAVLWGADNGIVQGYPGDVFQPNKPVTRQELAAMLMRYADFAEIDLPESRAYPGFADDAEIAEFAQEAVANLYKAEIIHGKSNNRFDPKGTAARAEFAAMLHRLVA